jgi:hypothetical protein
MSIKVFADTKIYIACPANGATGGPELLHQLAYHLINDLNLNVYMYYYFDDLFTKLKCKKQKKKEVKNYEFSRTRSNRFIRAKSRAIP